MILAEEKCLFVVADQGQCTQPHLPGSSFCEKHRNLEQAHSIPLRRRNYRLSRFQARMEEFADNEEAKSLREEIGILRMLLEETLNKCSNSTELLIASGKIADLVLKIEKLVSSCHRLESATGVLLNKSAIVQLAGVLIEIIGTYVKQENELEEIANKIFFEISKTQIPLDKDGKPL